MTENQASQQVAAEVLHFGSKSTIVRLDGRRFPGLWLPADTVFSWVQQLEENDGEDSGASFVAAELRRTLAVYARKMAELGEPTPFELEP